MADLMQLVTILGIGVGLAMDAFAVSVVSGSVFRELKVVHVLRMAFFFGAFQAFMPLIGYAAGQTVADYIEHFDHWVAFALLVIIGGKMIIEALKFEQVEKRAQDPANLMVVLTLSLATSIDALAVGITLSLVTDSILRAVAAIGVITFVLSYAGVQIGRRARHFVEGKIEILGGVILIVIGLKILLTHLLTGSAAV
ncbi:MAG: manganese efflux pump MntP family protein [Planctomycetaceae bacterium]|nr:manganese efflux pump MntP family protein [Planctomycetaceae bacterium]